MCFRVLGAPDLDFETCVFGVYMRWSSAWGLEPIGMENHPRSPREHHLGVPFEANLHFSRATSERSPPQADA